MKTHLPLAFVTITTLVLTGQTQVASDPWAANVEKLPGAVAPEQLVGEWSKSHMSTLDYVDPGTGSHASPSGERLNIHFFRDGTYKIGWLLQSSLYNCSSRVFGYKNGVYVLEGQSLTLQDKSYSLTSRDTCHPEWNYEKHAPLLRSTYELHLGRSKYGPVLIMRNPNGTEVVYSRETGKPLLSE